MVKGCDLLQLHVAHRIFRLLGDAKPHVPQLGHSVVYLIYGLL